jgi:hypothetical protein
MRGDWRLINGAALYDLATDPGQQRDVAADHPAIVAELRDAYEAWWMLCERQADDDIPISIGAEAAEVALLTSHDLRNDQGDGVWNQGQVRQGEACAGYWEVMVERPGTYEFALRRWPAEAGHALTASLGTDDVAFRRDAIAKADWGLYSGGVGLPIATAAIESGSHSVSVPVADGETAARLQLDLQAGPLHLRAWFAGQGLKQSPYYVEARLTQTPT